MSIGELFFVIFFFFGISERAIGYFVEFLPPDHFFFVNRNCIKETHKKLQKGDYKAGTEPIESK